MTTTEKERQVLNAYEEDPVDAGDLVLLVDGLAVVEIAGGADHWEEMDPQVLLTDLARAPRRVVPCIARPGADLLPADRTLWAQLREVGAASGVDVLPLQALPAA
jgi:hypothetical protein